jgi:hypothetical protein
MCNRVAIFAIEFVGPVLQFDHVVTNDGKKFM